MRDRIITIVKCALTNRSSRNCVTFGATLRRDGEADELCYVMHMFYSCPLLHCDSAIRVAGSGRNTVPDKSKIKDDITESWTICYFIPTIANAFPPLPFALLFAYIYEVRTYLYVSDRQGRSVRREFAIGQTDAIADARLSSICLNQRARASVR